MTNLATDNAIDILVNDGAVYDDITDHITFYHVRAESTEVKFMEFVEREFPELYDNDEIDWQEIIPIFERE